MYAYSPSLMKGFLLFNSSRPHVIAMFSDKSLPSDAHRNKSNRYAWMMPIQVTITLPPVNEKEYKPEIILGMVISKGKHLQMQQ